MIPIRIAIEDIEITGVLNDSEAANLVLEVLPVDSSFNTWGDEIYFSIPVEINVVNGQEVVEDGDIGYWPPGHAFCIFYGETPASRNGEIRAASEVAIIGKIEGDTSVLKLANKRAHITIERVLS
ncbi:MAG: cyclophilin-like fold protein [Chloroflexota bacterium]|nr:cyclophilin-like fold protein [Chloroflexota bacterium]